MLIEKVISAQEAFQAYKDGQNIVCRHIDDNFDSLDQFPATVFFSDDYEFAIKFPTQIISGFEFTRPLTMHEVKEDQDVFVINTDGHIRKCLYRAEDTELNNSIQYGFVQRDAENAISQLKAISCLLGFANDIKIEVLSAKKTRRSKKVDDLEQSDPTNKFENTDEPVITESVEAVKPAKVEAQAFDDGIIITSIEKAQTEQALENIALAINTAYMAHQIDSFKVDELRAMITERKRALLEFELIERAQNSATVAEANGLIRYTRDWTEEQRKPVLDAINAQLIELGKQNNTPLLDRVRFAKSLEELKLLESEHDDLDPSDPDFFAIIDALHQRKADFEGDRYIDG